MWKLDSQKLTTNKFLSTLLTFLLTLLTYIGFFTVIHVFIGFSKLLADQNIIEPQIIKKKIAHALSALSFRYPHVLVQFWSPSTIQKRCFLTTLDQPFGLGVVDEALYTYRLKAEQHMFLVDGERREELGPPGRVYLQKLPEWSLNVHTLPTRQSIHDLDACYNNLGYINMPVFEPDGGCCVGVLEIITSSNNVDYAFEVQELSRALKEENLKSPSVFEDPTFYVENERRQNELDEIFFALKMICDTQNIPLAQTWALSGFSSVVANSGNLERSCSSFSRNCIGKTCMSTSDLPFYVRNLSMWGFRKACRERHLEKSQGIVGKSLTSHGLCFCKDVTKLGEDEYPWGSYARVDEITSCLAIYLKSVESEVQYVIELVLPPQKANEADLQSLVKTVKRQFKDVSCVELGITSFLQVIGGDPLDWNIESPPSIESLTEKEEVLPAHGNQLLLENERIDVPYSKDESEVAYVEHMKDDNLEIELMDNAAAGTSQSVVPCLDARIEDVDIHKGKTETRNNSEESNKATRNRKRTERSISVEEISKHYGKPMEEAAVNLCVSRSTLKRICRGLDIPRWPYKNFKSNSVFKSNKTDAVIRATEGAPIPVLGTSSEPSGTKNITYVPVTHTEHGKQSSTVVHHKEEQAILPDGSAKRETIREQHIVNTSATNKVKTLTIKATYNENIVKFPFMLLDGLVKLEELVATRFQLSLGSFKLKYEDTDGDNILIASDLDLIELIADYRQPDNQTVIRLLVLPTAHQSPGAC
ncbi:PB1 domain, RWP-RK domain, lambda repressor-like, DNA-binding domain protein [Tanacetum coccineum]